MTTKARKPENVGKSDNEVVEGGEWVGGDAEGRWEEKAGKGEGGEKEEEEIIHVTQMRRKIKLS